MLWNRQSVSGIVKNYVSKHHYTDIMLYARKEAVTFYEKLGYEKRWDAFIEVTLPHYKIKKTLQKAQ